MAAKPVGSYGEADRDTQLCRAIHRLLVPGNPEVHCRHLSDSLSEADGGVCIDRTLADYNKRNFQCGYDDVGYVTDSDWQTPNFPATAADKARGNGRPFRARDLGDKLDFWGVGGGKSQKFGKVSFGKAKGKDY